MARVNKYNIHWQVVRVADKNEKDIEKRIDQVFEFLMANKSKENFERVKKWLRMSPLGFKDQQKKQLYGESLRYLTSIESMFTQTDRQCDFTQYTKQQLQAVYKDIAKRKYTFQSKGAPKSHNAFIDKLTQCLDNYDTN